MLNVFQFGVVVLDQLAKAAHRINPNVEVTGQAFKERFNAAAWSSSKPASLKL